MNSFTYSPEVNEPNQHKAYSNVNGNIRRCIPVRDDNTRSNNFSRNGDSVRIPIVEAKGETKGRIDET